MGFKTKFGLQREKRTNREGEKREGEKKKKRKRKRSQAKRYGTMNFCMEFQSFV